MPDITMCSGSGCLRRNTCYRATAKPTSDRQSFFVEAPVKPDQTCGYYWNNYEQVQEDPEAIAEWGCFLISLLVQAHYQYNLNRAWAGGGRGNATWEAADLDTRSRNQAHYYKWQSWV